MENFEGLDKKECGVCIYICIYTRVHNIRTAYSIYYYYYFHIWLLSNGRAS